MQCHILPCKCHGWNIFKRKIELHKISSCMTGYILGWPTTQFLILHIFYAILSMIGPSWKQYTSKVVAERCTAEYSPTTISTSHRPSCSYCVGIGVCGRRARRADGRTCRGHPRWWSGRHSSCSCWAGPSLTAHTAWLCRPASRLTTAGPAKTATPYNTAIMTTSSFCQGGRGGGGRVPPRRQHPTTQEAWSQPLDLPARGLGWGGWGGSCHDGCTRQTGRPQ